MNGNENGPPLFSGPDLSVCGKCRSLEGGGFCARCGEPVTSPGPGWFVLQLATRHRKARGELTKLDSYPGKVLEAGRMARLAVDSPAQIQWLAENMPTASTGTGARLTGSRGQVIASEEPVFQCLMGVMDSRIRGCMTQKFRRAHCRRESALLPLIEPMKTHSWADVLENAGKRQEARELVLGVLWQLDRTSDKIACPLFGPALRLTGRDVNRLPLLLASLRMRLNEGPIVRPLIQPNLDPASVGQSVQGPRTESPGRYSGMPWGDSGPILGARTMNGVLLHSGRAGGTVWFKDGVPRPIEDVPVLSRILPMGTGFALHFIREGKGQGCAALLPPNGDSVARLAPLGADAVSYRGDTVAVLQGRRERLAVVWSDPAGRRPVRCDWQIGLAFVGPYRLEVLGDGRFLVLGGRGGVAVLSPGGAALLSPAQGIARFSNIASPPREFSGVIDAVGFDDGSFAILSCDGHRITRARVERFRRVESPEVEVLWDAVLPDPGQRLTGDSRGTLSLGTGNHVMFLDARTGAPQGWHRRAPWGVCLEGGGLAWGSNGDWQMENPRETPEEAERSLSVDMPRLLATTLALAERAAGNGDEAIPVMDRGGRFPHKFTWGT